MAWVLTVTVTVAEFVVLGAVLRVLNRLEEEFLTDGGHSLRDLGDRLELAIDRIETGAVVDRVAVAGVAKDLVAQHERADAIEGLPGEASDAASRSSP